MSRWHYYMKTLGILYINVGTKDRKQKIIHMRAILEDIYNIIIEYDKDQPFHTHELHLIHRRICDLYNNIARMVP